MDSLIQNDQTVSTNYQRLIANTISGVFANENDSKSVAVLRDELTGKIRTAIERVFEDLKFSSLGNRSKMAISILQKEILRTSAIAIYLPGKNQPLI